MSVTGIHIFRKDLRLNDNFALYKLYQNVDKIILIFILDNHQIKVNSHNKHYISNNSIQFMCESLEDLYDQTNNKLLLFNGNIKDVIQDIIKKIKIDYISFNADYTQYALQRDNMIVDICDKNNIKTIIDEDDMTLIEMKELIKKDGTPYSVFGPSYKNEIDFEVNKPVKIKNNKYYKPNIIFKYKFDIKNLETLYDYNEHLAQRGGRKEALKKMQIVKHREDIMINTGLNISAYLNFGLISEREFYHKFKKYKDIIKNMYWRDYFWAILRYHPRGNSYTKFIDERYNKIKFTFDKKEWDAFINSKTGFLLIDASIKELLTTGYISNRARLLNATFWIKYLLIHPFDPQYGVQCVYSKYLVDCSCSQNKLNIQWVLGDLDLSGRRFALKGANPLSARRIRIDNEQIPKYDPEGKYIKKWLPHLKDKSVKELIKYETIFDWKERYQEYCDLFKNIK